MTFPQKLKKIRSNLGLSQEQLAEKMSVSRQAVSKWESGEGMPDTFNMKVLSKLSGYTIDDLLDNDPFPQKPLGFFDSVKDAFSHFSDFEGRASRRVFWWYALFVVLAFALCDVFDFITFGGTVSLADVFASIFAIGTLIPSLAIGVRRLRDTGENWQQMYWLLLPVFGLLYLCYLWAKPSYKE
jgi:uncharacterized membrane protein YhaH (DUF805 family)/DNA-binding XRE family transcriptional regulator